MSERKTVSLRTTPTSGIVDTESQWRQTLLARIAGNVACGLVAVAHDHTNEMIADEAVDIARRILRKASV